MKNKYALFNQLTQDLLRQSNELDNNVGFFIELYCNQVFGNDFFLQICPLGANFKWHRSTWLKEKDSTIVNQWFDSSFDEEDFNLGLSILKESGEGAMTLLKNVQKKINNLTIKPILFNDDGGRDGLGIVLTIGNETERTTFAWETRCTPKEWSSLDELLDELLMLNKQLLATKQQYFLIDYQYEKHTQGTTKMLETKKLDW